MTNERLLAMALMRITLLLALYCVALAVTLRFGESLPSTTWVSLPLQLCFCAAAVDFMRKSRLPLEAFGLSLGPAPRADVAMALRFTIPVLVVAAVLKAVLLPERPLLEPTDLAWLPLYPPTVVLQELVLRGAIQGVLLRLLPAPGAPLRALVVASTLFFVTHLHLSWPIALGSAPVGILWGVLYAKQGRLLGVVVSHTIIGGVTFFLLGISG